LVDLSCKTGHLEEESSRIYAEDPIIAKVIRHGTSRNDAINKLIDSLKGIYITGLNYNRDYLVSLLQTGLFVQNQIHTRLVELESMKMENKILASHKSIIKESHVSVGEQVQNTQLLFTLDTNDRSSDQ